LFFLSHFISQPQEVEQFVLRHLFRLLEGVELAVMLARGHTVPVLILIPSPVHIGEEGPVAAVGKAGVGLPDPLPEGVVAPEGNPGLNLGSRFAVGNFHGSFSCGRDHSRWKGFLRGSGVGDIFSAHILLDKSMEIEKLKAYLAEGLSLTAISKKEGRSLGSVRYWAVTYGLKSNFKNFKEEPYHKTNVVDGKRHCTRCDQWKFVDEFGPKGKKQTHHYCRPCLYAYQQERGKARKKKVIELMGGKCVRCGYFRNYAALEFHHLDPSKKEINIAGNGIKGSWKRLMAELQKCILICSNCHREEHHQDMFVLPDSSIELNRILNLEVHPTGNCPTCGTEVFNTKYCSHACSCDSRRRVKRPNREELERLINTTPFVQIGKKYGVSDNAIRKWANHYGLDWKAIKK